MIKYRYSILFFITFACVDFVAADSNEIQARMNLEAEQGKPLVAHIVVALCDNKTQGIVPVSKALGNGDSPRTNLYWGALYGVKTFFKNHKKWHSVAIDKPNNKSILERVAFTRQVLRNGKLTRVFVIADAWRGSEIKPAIEHFVDISSGRNPELLSLQYQDAKFEIAAAGGAHLTAYVGHNGLMDFNIAQINPVSQQRFKKSSIVLACYSDNYFSGILKASKSHSLLTTNGFMAPEAYTLEAAITSWFAGESPTDTHLAASKAYSRYQKANLKWTKTLFSTSK